MKDTKIPANIDGKNVSVDWFNEMFDDWTIVYGSNKCLGYIENAACELTWEVTNNILSFNVFDEDLIDKVAWKLELFFKNDPCFEGYIINISKRCLGMPWVIVSFYWKGVQ